MPAHGNWLSDRYLLALHGDGQTLEAIAAANEAETGWRPTRSGVLRKLQKIGAPYRYGSHKLVIPWRIAPAHRQDPLRYMLAAESRKRQGVELSQPEERLVDLLHDLLFGRGREWVVDYDDEDGFALRPRRDSDADIVRMPKVTMAAQAG